MQNFLVAIQFLTILPVRIAGELKPDTYGKALFFFPVVGALIGSMLAAIAVIFGFLPDIVVAGLVVIGSAVITGGIHLDGFADTCDGFYGGKSKERALDIMRDSRIGVMGIIGVVGILLLKFASFYSMPRAYLWKALIVMAVWGRFCQAMVCSLSRYARQEGKAKFFIERAPKRNLFLPSAFTFGISYFLMGWDAIFPLVLSLPIIFFFVRYSNKKISGMTGDTIGAVNEIAEVSMLLFCILFVT